jgi:hypothetical protein
LYHRISSSTHQNQGCDGGQDSLGFLWIMDVKGMPSTATYGPYLNADSECHADGKFMEGSVAIKGYYQVDLTLNTPPCRFI